jgi:hypothetical protein
LWSIATCLAAAVVVLEVSVASEDPQPTIAWARATEANVIRHLKPAIKRPPDSK